MFFQQPKRQEGGLRCDNRSHFHVRDKARPDLDKQFPFYRARDARNYLEELRAAGHDPALGQYEDRLLVRIRNKGYPDFEHTFGSLAEAARLASVYGTTLCALLADTDLEREIYRELGRMDPACRQYALRVLRRLCCRYVI